MSLLKRSVLLVLASYLTACIHSGDFPKNDLELSEQGRKVNFISDEMKSDCQAAGKILGRGQAYEIPEAVDIAIKDAQNRAGKKSLVNGLSYESTDARQQWRTHFLSISFKLYTCPEESAPVLSKADKKSRKKSLAEKSQVRANASATAEAQAQINAQAAAQMAAAQASQAAAAAAAQSAAQAAAQSAAMSASQAAAMSSIPH